MMFLQIKKSVQNANRVGEIIEVCKQMKMTKSNFPKCFSIIMWLVFHFIVIIPQFNETCSMQLQWYYYYRNVSDPKVPFFMCHKNIDFNRVFRFCT